MLDTVHCTSLEFVNVMQKMTDCQTDMSLYKNLTVGWLSKIPQPHYIKITALKYLFKKQTKNFLFAANLWNIQNI